MAHQWKETISENGDKYYYNESTNETRWEPPAEGFEPANNSTITPPTTNETPTYLPDEQHHPVQTTTISRSNTLPKSTPTSNNPVSIPHSTVNTNNGSCSCCPPVCQPCCARACGDWHKRLKISVAIALFGILVEEILIGILFLLYFDSGVSRSFMSDVPEINYGICSDIASQLAFPRFYVAAGMIWALGISFLSFHKTKRFVTFRGFNPPGTQHALQIKVFFLLCMIAHGAYSLYALGLPLLILEVLPPAMILVCVVIDSWRIQEKK